METRLVRFVNEYSLLFPHQFDIPKKVSPVDDRTNFTVCIYDALNENQHCIIVFINLKKAIDTVNHSQVLLNEIDMGLGAFRWIE